MQAENWRNRKRAPGTHDITKDLLRRTYYKDPLGRRRGRPHYLVYGEAPLSCAELHRWRRWHQLTQKQVAIKLDVHPNTYRYWENTARTMPIDLFDKLCWIHFHSGSAPDTVPHVDVDKYRQMPFKSLPDWLRYTFHGKTDLTGYSIVY